MLLEFVTYIGRKAKNKVTIYGEEAEIETRNGTFRILTADLDIIKNYTWQMLDNEYVFTVLWIKGKPKTNDHPKVKGKQKTMYLHRFLMNCPDDKEVDHRNRDRKNNRRDNLRIVNRFINNMNKSKNYNRNTSSQYKGVEYKKEQGYWSARIAVDKKVVSLGNYKDEASAANAYNFYSKIYLGEYSVPNSCELKEDWYTNKVSLTKYSNYRGVTLRSDIKTEEGMKWQAGTQLPNGKYKVTSHPTEIEAAKEYNKRALELGWELPRLNIIEGEIYGVTEEIILERYRYKPTDL